MAQQKVELRKIRDFSENLNDTILFIKQNFKPLIISFLTIAGVFLLAQSIANGVYEAVSPTGMFREIVGGSQTYSVRYGIGAFTRSYFIIMLLTYIGLTAMHVVILGYMKVYDEKGGEVATTQEVWEVFKHYYFKVLIYNIPAYLLIILGFLFCILPGIYLAVVLLPFPVALIMEDETFGGAFDRCFVIIKENFWQSLGIYFVVYIIYAFSSTIISSVVGLVAAGISYLTTSDVRSTVAVGMSVLNVFSFVFYIIFFVSVAFHYFSLVEKYEGTGLMRRLDKLGEGGPDFNNIKEEY